MAGRLETSIWNLTLLATATACGEAVTVPSHGIAMMVAGDWDGDAEQEVAISNGFSISILDRFGKGE